MLFILGFATGTRSVRTNQHLPYPPLISLTPADKEEEEEPSVTKGENRERRKRNWDSKWM